MTHPLRVGPSGSVTRIDSDREAVAAAREAIVAAGVDNATVRLGEAAGYADAADLARRHASPHARPCRARSTR
jgi:precorrin-6B methylase 2